MSNDALGVVAGLVGNVCNMNDEITRWYESVKVGIACRTECCVYMTNPELGNIYRFDANNHATVSAKIAPFQPTKQRKIFGQMAMDGVTEFRVSRSETSYGMYYREREELVHYNSKQKVWTVLEHRINILDFSFIGEAALICIIHNGCEFRIYNTMNRCLVRKFMTPHVARASVLLPDVYWTVGFSMSIHHRDHHVLLAPPSSDATASINDTIECNESLMVSLL